jgi:predicted MFS family arabinose efflux permease
MAVATLPGVLPRLPLLLASRLAVGAGEAAMMAAAVLWLLRLAGPAHRGRALGHVGLANYAGLTVGPPLARLVGTGHQVRVLVLAAALPLLTAALVATLHSRGDASGPAAPPAGPVSECASEPSSTAPSRTVDRAQRGSAVSRPSALLRATARPGLGLLLVNVGYVAVLGFASAAAATRQVHLGALTVPLFGAGVIAGRTILGWVPDRVGPNHTLTAAVLAEAAGLVGVALSTTLVTTIAALLLLALGQGLAVPALGMLALAAVPPADHGVAGGLFFGYFDAGVGLGGPAVGLVAERADPAAALLAAACTVLAAAPAALLSTAGRRRGGLGATGGDFCCTGVEARPAGVRRVVPRVAPCISGA